MNDQQVIEIANHVTMQRLLEQCLSNCPPYFGCEICGTTVIVEPAPRRTGVPEDAESRRYLFTNVAQGWSVVMRAVWRNHRLHQPVAVHTVVDHYLDDDGRHGSDAAVPGIFNQWLRALDL